MHYYDYHIGDFNKKTRHLSRLERSIYRDLLDYYYESERPLPVDFPWLCKKVLASTKEEIAAVDQILNEFFLKTPNGWWNERCAVEIDKYHSNTSQRSLAGKASAIKRAQLREQALNGCSTDVERTYQREGNGESTASQLTRNHEPLTTNHEPKTNNTVAIAPDELRVAFAEFWSRFPSDFGAKGSRKNAESAYLKLKPDKVLQDTILIALDRQILEKATKQATNQFTAPFQHVERWLKNRRWEDEPDRSIPVQRKLTGSERSAQEFDEYRRELAAGRSGQDLADTQGNGIVLLHAKE